MCENVGGYDRALRIIVGTVILLITLMASSWWGLVGLIPLLTGTFGFCPLYPLLKINTKSACASKAGKETVS